MVLDRETPQASSLALPLNLHPQRIIQTRVKGQEGEFNLEKSSSEAPAPGFDIGKCPVEILLPGLSADVILLCDNVLSHPADVADYVSTVDRLADFSAIKVPIGKDLHIGYRQKHKPRTVQAMPQQ